MPARSSRARLFFTSLRMRGWRNFKGPVDMDLRRRVFLIGPNASGKSNILDAFRFLRDVATDGLDKAVASRGGVAQIRTLQATRPAGTELAVKVGTDEAPDTWSYRLCFRNDSKRHLPEVVEEEVRHNGAVVLKRPDGEDGKDPARLKQTHLEQISANHGFRGLSEFLQSIRYLHVVPHLVRDPERSVGRRDDPYGGDFLEKVAATPPKKRDARLRKINRALQIAVPQFEGLRLHKDDRGRSHLEARFKHWRRRDAKQYERAFSDGVLRLIGLFWSLAEGGGPLLLEEPELSLHDSLVRRLPGMMARMHVKSGRQVLITTHSSAMLVDEGIGLDEVHVLLPDDQGTEVKVGGSDKEVRAMVEEGGLSIGDVLLPKAAPKGAHEFDF